MMIKFKAIYEIESEFPLMTEVVGDGYDHGEKGQMVFRQDFYMKNAPQGAVKTQVHGHPDVDKFLHLADGTVEQVIYVR